MSIQGSQISALSSRARFKGKVLFYSLILQNINFILLGVLSGTKGTLPAFHILVAIMGLTVLYKFRPGNIQKMIDNWSDKNQFPIKSGAFKIIKLSFTLSFLMALASLFSRQDPIEVNSVLMWMLSIPILFFIYDSELTKFIWDK